MICLLLLATSTPLTAGLASDSFVGASRDSSLAVTSTLEASENATPTPTPDVIPTCHDQRVSSLRAIRMIIVLAAVSALHLPGSLVFQKRSRFYRFAPEVGLVDLIATLVTIAQSAILHKRSLREAVTAVLICRHFTPKEDEWWNNPEHQDNGPAVPDTSDSFQSLQEPLARMQTLGSARILYMALAMTTVSEAFLGKTSLALTLLVVLYAIPLFALELISLAALCLNPSHSVLERRQEMIYWAKLITEIQQPIPVEDQRPLRQRCYHAIYVVILVLLGIPAVLSLFYPFSVLGFIFFTFSEWHSASGQWYVSWLTWAGWLLCLLVVILSLFILTRLPAWIMARPFPDLCTRYCESRDRLVASFMGRVFSERTSRVFLADVYTVLKVTVVIKNLAS